MLSVPNDMKNEFLIDGQYKEMIIRTEAGRENTYDKINFYVGGYNEDAFTAHTNYPSGGTQMEVFVIKQDSVNYNYLSYGAYAYVSVNFKVSNVTALPSRLKMNLALIISEGTAQTTSYEIDLTNQDIADQITGDGIRLFAMFATGNVTAVHYLDFVFPDGFVADYSINHAQVSLSDSVYDYNDLYENDSVPYLGESIARQGQSIDDYIYKGNTLPIADVTNEDLEVENYIQTESLSSGENLKFGACEASFCEFTVRNRNDNWKDRYINPSICLWDEPYNVTMINWYMGGAQNLPTEPYVFSRANIPMNWINGTAEHYLAPNLNYGEFESLGKPVMAFRMKIKFTISRATVAPSYVKIGLCLKYNSNQTRERWEWNDYSEFTVSKISDFVDFYSWIPLVQVPETEEYFPHLYEVSKINFYLLDENKQQYPTNTGTFNYRLEAKEIQLCLCDAVYWDDFVEFDVNDCMNYQGLTLNEYIIEKTGNIPLGRFCVKEISKVHKTGVQQLKLTAYDDLIKLDTNAYNWYIKYMWGFNTSDYTSRYGLECTRQIYSAYHNIMYTLGIEKRRTFYPETVVQHHEGSDIGDLSNGEKTFIYSIDSSSQIQIRWAAFVVTDADCMHPYSADVAFDEAFIRSNMRNYAIYVDRQWRGCDNANVIIEPLNGDNLSLFCVDSYDLFMIPPNCTSFKVWYPYKMVNDTYVSGDYINPVSSVEICKSSRYVDLVNASTRLMYYRWMGDHEIFSVDSSITARDVVRSLLEVTGCFLHIDRYGKPAFKYCTKSGLYPANDLYPADDLYPRGLDGSTLSLDGYISAETEDYSVKDIGRIQIVKHQINNENSVVEWEYIGDASMQNTYLIDDNIFYCNESMEYEYGSMQDVADMLENMYNRISNMGYMPGKFIITGMPWLEVGDRIGLLTFAGGVETFVFRRTYKGIIAPKDTIVSQGDEYTEAVKDYGYIVS